VLGPTTPRALRGSTPRQFRPIYRIFDLMELERRLPWLQKKYSPHRVAMCRQHILTDYSDFGRFPQLRKIGCVEPVPYVETDLAPRGCYLMIECSQSRMCFAREEATADFWIPGPREVEARRDRIKLAWTPEQAEQHEVQYEGLLRQRRDARRVETQRVSEQEWSARQRITPAS